MVCGAQLGVWTVHRAARLNRWHGDGVGAGPIRLSGWNQHRPAPCLVVDFGAQYAQLIARRVREARVYSEVIPHTASVEEIKDKDPQAIVLSGGPASVYADGAPQLDPALFDLGVPVFGICYGFQAMAQALGRHRRQDRNQ